MNPSERENERWNGSRDQRLLHFPAFAIPSFPALVASVFSHFLVLAVIVVILRAAPVHVKTAKYQKVERISGATHFSFSSRQTQPNIRPAPVSRRPRRARAQESGAAAAGTTGEALREQAQQATAEITTSLRFRMIYGFNRDHEYRLAVQTAGEVPAISVGQVPAHFQQYVIIEVTIDTEGRVADARIVAGLVDPAIQQILLSAIHEFKYNPATRDGIPIPSQRDIVIHIPT